MVLDPFVYIGEALPSRVMILNQVMDALKDPNLHMIGVCGMGGIGKTTLAKEVYRKAVEEELFDFVVMVTVSQTPDLRRIQGEIADFLEEVPTGGASRLHQRLKYSKVLIILDDIWAKLDMSSIGIPFGDKLERSKILLTSRRKDVLCFEMGIQKDFSLEVLHDDEAMILFEMTMGEAKHLELRAIADEVVQRCAGLPLLIIIVATYLKNRKLSACRDTLKKLFDIGNEELHGKVHKVLKSIYESLPSNEVKSFFLLCALFGGPNIPVNHLLTYAMGLGLFGNIIRLQDARKRLFQIIKKLKTESLLLDDLNEHVKMYDVVLDVARTIATKEQHAFYGISGDGLREWPSRDCTRIALLYCDINEVPQGLKYPKTELLSLFSKDRNLEIPNLFFEGFRELKVLNLRGIYFMSLPTSLLFLTNLNSLYLHQCQLMDVTIIGDLKQLEFLSFADSYIVELPKQIEHLSQLKLLDLTNCTRLKVFPANVLSKLSLLEELYMGNSFVRWDVEGNINVMELEKLYHLTSLEIQVIDAKEMPNRLFFRGLQRYKISIGDDWAWDGTYEASKALKLRLKTVIHMKDGLKELLRGTQVLYLDEIKEIENLLYDIDGAGCLQLKHLHIRNDNVIQHVINSTIWASSIAFSLLETLSLDNLKSLEVICDGQLENGPFSKLRILKISRCNKLRDLFTSQCESIFSKMVIFPNLTSLIVRECGSLKYIFKSSTIKNILQLKRLVIECCDSVEEIIFTDENINKIVFPNLDFLRLVDLPNLKKFSNGYSIEFKSLKKMEIKECHKLRNIVSNVSNGGNNCDIQFLANDTVSNVSNGGNNYDIQSLFNDTISYSNLTSLIVRNCGRLKYIFTSSTIEIFLHLKKLVIENCDFLEKIILREENNSKIIFPNMDFLRLAGLPNLEKFSNGYPIEFQSLKKMEIKDCHKLMNIVSNIPKRSDNSDIQSLFNDMVAFPNLQIMRVCGMKNLEFIWHTSPLTADSFCKLKSLTISTCENLLAVFSSNVVRRFLRLEDLDICNCPNINEIYQLGELNSIEVAAFELKHLKIYSLDSLKRIWSSEDGDGIFSFKNLKSVEVHNCEVMEYVFPTSIACDLLLLEKLDIWNCLEVEHIVGKGKGIESDDETPQFFNFPELTFLRLQCLWELRSFYPKTYFFGWPKLKYLKVRGCHETMKLDVKVSSDMEKLMLDCKNSIEFSMELFSRLKVIELSHLKDEDSSFPFGFLRRLYSLEKFVLTFSSLERIESILFDGEAIVGEEENVTTIVPLKYLKVEHCGRLKYIAPSSVSFQNLMTLHIAHCDQLENLVTTSTAKSMVHLKELKITFCEMMKEIVANDGDDPNLEIIFKHLKCLELQFLPTLYSFCSGNYIFHFPLLEKVVVEDCLRMKIFCGGVLNTPKLRGVRHYWKYEAETQYCWEGNLNQTIASQCLKKKVLQNAYNWYVIEDLSSSKAISANQLQFLNNLIKINVRDCDSVQVVFDLEDTSIGPWLYSLLDKLKEIQLINLPKLSELWNKDPMRMFNFRKLRLLKVQNCSSLKYAFNQAMASSLIELQMIEIENCKMMEAIIKEEEVDEIELYEMTLPSLKKISIKGCPSMKGFMSPILLREHTIGRQEIHEIAVPKLEELIIDWNIIKPELDDNNQSDFFTKPKVIELVFPSCSFPTIEELVLSDFLAEEINIDGLDNHYELLPRLRKIILSKLSNLRHIVYDNDHRIVSIFQNLQLLQVWECSSLKTLVPSFVYFQNLTFLQVSKCDELINLITVSTAKTLTQLKKMYVGRCKMMEEIVEMESDGEEDEIYFPQLEYLVLDDLSCLISFCLSKNTLNFSCLEELFVIKCPKMKTFARAINTPKLSQVQTGGKEYEWKWEGNLNSTIQALSMESNAEEIDA